MNNKIVSTKKTSAIFLAIVLVVGTFALSSPSFMTIGAAQAQPDYYSEMDNDYQKSYGKDNRDKSKNSVNVKKVKCNNINVNGLELNVTSFPFLSGIVADDADASESKYDAASYGNGASYGGHSSSDKDGFVFICINNNNNTVVGIDDDGVTPLTPEEECEECFRQNLDATAFAALDAALEAGIDLNLIGQQIEINSLLELCTILEDVTDSQFGIILRAVLAAADIRLDIDTFVDLVLCIAEALEIEIDLDVILD